MRASPEKLLKTNLPYVRAFPSQNAAVMNKLSNFKITYFLALKLLDQLKTELLLVWYSDEYGIWEELDPHCGLTMVLNKNNYVDCCKQSKNISFPLFESMKIVAKLKENRT